MNHHVTHCHPPFACQLQGVSDVTRPAVSSSSRPQTSTMHCRHLTGNTIESFKLRVQPFCTEYDVSSLSAVVNRLPVLWVWRLFFLCYYLFYFFFIFTFLGRLLVLYFSLVACYLFCLHVVLYVFLVNKMMMMMIRNCLNLLCYLFCTYHMWGKKNCTVLFVQ